jgi:hypothetical protein
MNTYCFRTVLLFTTHKTLSWQACLPLSAVAPIEDDYFLQVDSGGSNPGLMPPGEYVGNTG